MDSALSTPDAIVVLGCRVYASGEPSPAARRRAVRAARAQAELGARVVVASGGRAWGGVTEADVLARLLVEHGVAEDVVVRELCSHSTVENAHYTARILQAAGLSRVAVVTCDWHAPRAVAAFVRAGLDATALPSTSPPRGAIVAVARALRERARTYVDGRVARHWAAP